MKKITIIITSFLVAGICFSQQDGMFTHYSFNTLLVNPAYAGSRGVTTVTGLSRNQWVGFEGAPITQTITVHSPVFNDRLGVGLSLGNDKIGPSNSLSIFGDFSYQIQLTRKTKLAFGLKGGGALLQGDLATLESKETEVESLFFVNKFLPNLGAGLYLNNDTWYLGVSAPKVLENKILANSNGSEIGGKRHYFFIAGFIKKINRFMAFKPTGYIKATESAPLELDLTALLIFNEVFETGLMIRSGDALGVLFGFNFNNQFRVGYSFDWSFANATGKYNNGSHEIMLRYDIININKGRVYSPRYF